MQIRGQSGTVNSRCPDSFLDIIPERQARVLMFQKGHWKDKALIHRAQLVDDKNIEKTS